jgi:hypothetical protein
MAGPDELADLQQPGPEPPALARDLAALSRAPIEIPRRIDDSVLTAARSALAAPLTGLEPGRRRRLRALGAAAAAAGAVLATAWIVARPPRATAPHAAAPPLAAAPTLDGDLDRNGRVDVLDAFLLARQLDAGASSAHGDLTRDGVVDRDDVDAIAMLAVTLPEETG